MILTDGTTAHRFPGYALKIDLCLQRGIVIVLKDPRNFMIWFEE